MKHRHTLDRKGLRREVLYKHRALLFLVIGKQRKRSSIYPLNDHEKQLVMICREEMGYSEKTTDFDILHSNVCLFRDMIPQLKKFNTWQQ